MTEARERVRETDSFAGSEVPRMREILETDLRRLAPDLEVVDRGLQLPRGRLADLVLVDGSGCPLLALVVEGRRDEVVQAAVDALVFARENAGALALLRPGPAPRVVRARVALVAESFSERCLEALALFPRDELWILEAKRFESESGTRHVLVSITPPPTPPAPGDRDRRAFLARVQAPMRDAAESLLRRLARLDRDVQTSFAEDRASVRSGDLEICALEVQDGLLAASASGIPTPRRIEAPLDAEAFLDEVVRRRLRGEEREAEEPLLTPEELAAFRD